MRKLFMLGLSDIIVCPAWFNEDPRYGQLPDGLDPLRPQLEVGQYKVGEEPYTDMKVEPETKIWMTNGSLFKIERGHWVSLMIGTLVSDPESAIWLVDGYPSTLLRNSARDFRVMINEGTEFALSDDKAGQRALRSKLEIPYTDPTDTCLAFGAQYLDFKEGFPHVYYTQVPTYKAMKGVYTEAKGWAKDKAEPTFELIDLHNERLDIYFPEITQYITNVEGARRQMQSQQSPLLNIPQGPRLQIQ